ncbi:MAG: hypothetical protein FJY83_09440 [Candidatus Aminicenantes bacterium]|nr:hypothetical protein [Candidatus Aminicenantes bacterium]
MPLSSRALAREGPFVLILGLAALVRLPYLLYWDLFFSSDTAVLGLMARRFLRGEFSIYYWGEAYYGALDPLLLAPLFKVFGATPAVSHVIPFVFSLLTVWLFHRYARRVLDPRSAHIATLVLALAPPAFFQAGFSVYNYTFVMFFGVIHLILFDRYLRGDRRKTLFFLSGLVAGFSWYYFRLILVFWAAILLTAVVKRFGREEWLKWKAKAAALSLSRLWNNVLLLRRAPLPRAAKAFLAVINFYNLANLALACFLWIRGDWFWTLGRLKVKLYLWPIFRTSVLLALLVFAAAHYRKALPLWRKFRADAGARFLALGFLAGFSPALAGYATGLSPSSPGGLMALPQIIKNLTLAVPEMTVRLAGSSRIPALQQVSMAVAVAVTVFLAAGLWSQTRRRFREGTPVEPVFPLLALFLTTWALGIAGTRLEDPNTTRFFVPLFFCLPVGLALGLKALTKKSAPAGWVLLAAFLANSLAAHIPVWKNHRSPAWHELMARDLAAEKVRGGYADYWTAYYLTFLTGEKIILTPVSGKERYRPYVDFVKTLEEVILLGIPAPPEGARIRILDTEYEVVRRDIWESHPASVLKKIPSP